MVIYGVLLLFFIYGVFNFYSSINKDGVGYDLLVNAYLQSQFLA